MRLSEILYWLGEEDQERLKDLWRRADQTRREHVGDQVHLRGLVEFSNHCVRNCTYCGLRAGNSRLRRYRMTREDILKCAKSAWAFGYGTVVLQSGEDEGLSAQWLAEVIKEIKDNYPLAVTLSVGEYSYKEYRLWRESGADRYLLKFETSDEELYRKIHPRRRIGEPNRITQLRMLRELGYAIGSGIMVGLPGQTYESLARDLELFRELDLDMIGIGPYIAHPYTPLGQEYIQRREHLPAQVPNDDLTTYKAVALARILCPEANIPATTALATVDPCGFEGGLRAGANVIMPNLTPLFYRALYQIYPSGFYISPETMHEHILRLIRAEGRVPGQGRGDRPRTESRGKQTSQAG